MSEVEKLIIHLVETPECCFITDCIKNSGYDYEYHRSKIQNLYFDGEKPTPTFAKNWMRISKYPNEIERLVSGKRENERYELKDSALAFERLPSIISCSDKDAYDSEVISALYEYRYEKSPATFEAVDVDIQKVLSISEYVEPSLKYEAIGKFGLDTKNYTITSADIQHQLFDKLLFPEVCMAHRPCSLLSKQVYDITRQYVLTHIDPAVAEITSNYDFCFTVKKKVPKIEPETVTYQNLFAKTKRDRSKIHTSVKNHVSYEIFQMTHSPENYRGYTPIPAMYANSEAELQQKMDEWLSTLIRIINTPIAECAHCNGTGFAGEIVCAKHDILKSISDANTNK